jgi:hypothetical protein
MDYSTKLGKGEFMCIQRISRIGVLAGCCAAAVFLIGVATSAFSSSSSRQVLDPSASVERAGKADRLMHVEGLVSADDVIAVELTGPSDIVIRDRYGNVLFAMDHSARMTTVGKRRGRRAIFPEVPGKEEQALPEGCEGAFSPYVEPARAHILGRCISGVFPVNSALS